MKQRGYFNRKPSIRRYVHTHSPAAVFLPLYHGSSTIAIRNSQNFSTKLYPSADALFAGIVEHILLQNAAHGAKALYRALELGLLRLHALEEQ